MAGTDQTVFAIFQNPLRATLERCAKDSKWSIRRSQIIADICDWQLARPGYHPNYEGEDGQPDEDMQAMLLHVHKADLARKNGMFERFRKDFTKMVVSATRGRYGYFLWQQDKQHTAPDEAQKREILAVFGAAHVVMCDTITGYRPRLTSAWERRPGLTPDR